MSVGSLTRSHRLRQSRMQRSYLLCPRRWRRLLPSATRLLPNTNSVCQLDRLLLSSCCPSWGRPAWAFSSARARRAWPRSGCAVGGRGSCSSRTARSSVPGAIGLALPRRSCVTRSSRRASTPWAPTRCRRCTCRTGESSGPSAGGRLPSSASKFWTTCIAPKPSQGV